MVNIFLAGMTLGIIYIHYDQIWAPIGWHAGWNFFQGPFYGFEVSGLPIDSAFTLIEKGPDFLTGGAFGFEGSILATISMILFSYFILKRSPSKFYGLYLHSHNTSGASVDGESKSSNK